MRSLCQQVHCSITIKQTQTTITKCKQLTDLSIDTSHAAFSVESQLQSKRFRWPRHIIRMPADRLPQKLLFGQVKGRRPPGCPRSSVNDVAMRDFLTASHK